MFRINPFSLRESLSKRTKEVGKLDDFIHSTVIPRGTNFPGFSLDSFIKPRIKFADNQLSSRNTFFRENIIRRMDSESPTSYHKSNKLKTEEKHSSIEFSSLFASGDPLRAVIYVENSDDNTALFHHIIFEWSNNRLWSDRFTHIFKIDLSSVLKSKFISDLSFMTNYEGFIAMLVHDSLDNSDSISVSEIQKHLLGKGKMSKTLILCDGIGKIAHLITLSRNSPMNSYNESFDIVTKLLKIILKYPKIMLSANNHISDIIVRNYVFDIALENAGFLKSDFRRYIEAHFSGEDKDQLLDFIRQNHHINEIKSPSILKMICYILTQSDGIKLKSVANSATLSSLYYDMFSLMRKEFSSHYNVDYKKSVIHFMQDLAFKTVSKTRFLISDLIKSYQVEGSSIIELVSEFKLVQYESNSLDNSDTCVFKDTAFRDFMAASYLRKLLISGEEDDLNIVKLFLSRNKNKLEFLRVIKFLSGLISLINDEAIKENIMSVFWNAFSLNIPGEVVISGDEKYILTMELLSQNIVDGKIDPLMPKEIIDDLDNAIISDISKWRHNIVKTQYSSPKIIDFIKDFLVSEDIKICLLAIELLPILNIRNQEVKKEIAENLIDKIKFHSSLEIVEASIRSLQSLEDFQIVKDFLKEVLVDKRSNVVLVTIEIISNIADISYLDGLYSKLQDSNPWVVCAAMEAIKKISIETRERELFNDVIVKILSFPQDHNLMIVDKAFDLFTRIKIDPKIIFENIKLSLLKADYLESIKHLSALKSLIKFKLQFDYDQVFESLEKKILPYSKFLHINTQEEYDIEKHVLIIFVNIYLNLNELNREKTYSFLKNKLGSDNKDIKIVAIQVLSNIPEHVSKTMQLLEEKIDNSKYMSAKIESMSVTISMFSNFSARSQNSIIINVMKVINKNKDHNFIVATIGLLNKALQQVRVLEEKTRQNRFLLIESLLNEDNSKYTSSEVRIEIIKLIASNVKSFGHEEVRKSFIYIKKLVENTLEENIRIEAIIALVEIFEFLPNKDDIIKLLLLDENMKSTSLEVRTEIISAFENIIPQISLVHHLLSLNQRLLFEELQKKLNDPAYLHKTFLMKILSKFHSSVINLSHSFVSDLIKQILESGSNEIRNAATKYLVRLYKSDKEAIKGVFNHFITLLSNKATHSVDYRSEESAVIVIGVLIDSENIKYLDIESAVTILLKEVNQKSSLYGVSLISIGKIISFLPEDMLIDVVNALIEINSLEITDNNILDTILTISCDLIKNYRISSVEMEGLKQNSYKIIEKKLQYYNLHNTGDDLIDGLIIRYSSKLIQLSPEDIKNLEFLFEVVFLRALESDNHLVHNSLFYLLSRSAINIDKLLVILEYKLSSLSNIIDKNRILSLVRNKFTINEYIDDDYIVEEFNNKLLDLEREVNPDIIDLFPDTQAILSDPEIFAGFVKEHGLNVRITINYIEVLERKYSLKNIDDINSQANNAKKIVISLIESEKKDEANIVATKHMFSDFTNTHLVEDKVQFSILHQVTNNKFGSNLINIILIFEEMTVFGYVLIKVVTIYNKKVSIQYHKSTDKNYKQNIFGDPTEDYFYHIKSVSVDKEEANKIFDSDLYQCESSVCLVRSATDSLEMPELNRDYSHDWPESLAVSRSMLVGLNSYMQELKQLKERQDITESRVKELEVKVVELTKDFNDFMLSQESINEMALFLHKQENPNSMEGLTPYQAAVARTIMFELDALITAARVVHKDRIANAQTGPAGSIAKLFSMLGGLTPVVGPAVVFISSFLSSYDANAQAKISANILKFAPTGVKAESIIEKIAIAIARGEIHLDKLPKEGLFEKIFAGIIAIPDLQDIAIDSIVGFFASKMAKGNIIDSDIERGKSEGEEISNILIAIISSGQCDEVAWEKNDQILLDYFSINGYIDFPITSLPLLLIPPFQGNKPFEDDKHDGENTYINIEIDRIDFNKEILVSGGIMKAAEVWPSTKYLLTNWIPIIPFLQTLGITNDFVASNEHKITAAIYTAGAVSFTCFADGNLYVALSAGVLFNIKPYIYEFQNNILERIYNSQDTDGYVKFGLYVATEAALTVVSVPLITHPYDLAKMIINNPISFINDPTTKIGLMQGAFTGALKYLSHLTPSEENVIGSIISFPVPPAVAYFSYNYFQDLSRNGGVPTAYIILISANTVSEAAFAHYSAKIVGDYIGEKAIDYIGQDFLSITNSSEL
jgi:hypothetical protein